MKVILGTAQNVQLKLNKSIKNKLIKNNSIKNK
jgi:hypothetical protein